MGLARSKVLWEVRYRRVEVEKTLDMQSRTGHSAATGIVLIRVFILALSAAAASHGQTLVTGRVLDPSNTPVAGIRVSLRQRGQMLSTTTSELGLFRFADAVAGDAELRTEVPGFDPVRLRIRAGSQPARELLIRLKIAAVREELNVAAADNQVSAVPGENADALSVERTMLDTLPVLDNNYLSMLSRFLNPGTPGDAGASLIVDGMESRNVGVTASAIQEIRINNNPYTVEYPRWSRRRIEVITKSAADSYHGTVNILFRDYHFNARDALAAQRPREQRRIFEGSLFGPAGKSKNTAFLLSGAREEEDLVAVVVAQSPAGTVNANVPTPQVNTVAALRVSRQWNEKHAMFWQVNFQDRWQSNAGAGGTTLAEAATQNRFREDEFTFNHRAILRTKLLSQFRILVGRYWSPVHSNVNAPKSVVTDAFTGGGAQADRLATEFHTSIAWLLTQSIGHHTLKYGFNVPDWSRRGLRDQTNLIGTLSFASLAEFSAGRPFAALLQRGDPRVVFIEKNVGGFLQDEWQLRPNLSIAGGFRYDWQNYFGDTNNVQPRLAIAYAPDKGRKWVVRTGAGGFFERSGPGPILDVLRFNGTRLRRYVLSGAAIPNDLPAFDGRGMPTSVHELEPNIQLPGVLQFSAGVERQLRKRSLVSVGYIGTIGYQQFRSRDANAPLPPAFAARPDASLNVLRRIERRGRLEGNALEITLRGELAPRISGMTQYVFGKSMSDTGGVNWFPANSFAPEGEWARADTDRRHQWNFLGAANLHRWASFGVSASLLSGLPYNVTTGRDGNQDGMALDRPPGYSRNSGKGPGVVALDLRWYREFRLQPHRKAESPALTISIDAFNIPNRVNYQNFVGAQTSPFFGRAVATMPPRRLQGGLRIQF